VFAERLDLADLSQFSISPAPIWTLYCEEFSRWWTTTIRVLCFFITLRDYLREKDFSNGMQKLLKQAKQRGSVPHLPVRANRPHPG
jgi:hypothetical protein